MREMTKAMEKKASGELVGQDAIYNSELGLQDHARSRIKYPLEVYQLHPISNPEFISDKDSITKGDNGKFCIKPSLTKNQVTGEREYSEMLKRKDLADSMKFTIIGLQKGLEVTKGSFETNDRTTVAKVRLADDFRLSRDSRVEWEESNGMRITYVNKLVLTQYNNEEVIQMLEDGKNPFVHLVISGGGKWKTYGEMKAQMAKLCREFPNKPEIQQVLLSKWQLEIKKASLENASGVQYFGIEPVVSVNTDADAMSYTDWVRLFREEFNLFFPVEGQGGVVDSIMAMAYVEKVQETEAVVTEAKPVIQKPDELDFSKKARAKRAENKRAREEAEKLVKEEVSIDDLPF